MDPEIILLCGTAATLGVAHTAVGPDHYLPFIMMSRARQWTLGRTLWITFLCGLGHVLSSVVLGLVGVGLGIAVLKLETFEGMRGSVAAWMLIGFGFAYFLWGVRRAIRGREHSHVHVHADGTMHDHTHGHEDEHAHVHEKKGRELTPWVLFVVFVLGPCEVLIPLLMYPAAERSVGGLLLVTGVFGFATVGTMLLIVALLAWGASFARLGSFERYTHALAGGVICLSGLAIQVLGL